MLPLCRAALLHPKRKLCSSKQDWWCSDILLGQSEWCKVFSEAKLFLMQISMESHGWAALWEGGAGYSSTRRWERKVRTTVTLGDKNGCNCQLHWEKWTLKGFKDGQGEDCGFFVLLGMCRCPDLLVVLGSSLPDCFATCASRSWGIKDSMTVLSVVSSRLEHFIWFILKYFTMWHHSEKEKERADSRRKRYAQKYIIIKWY